MRVPKPLNNISNPDEADDLELEEELESDDTIDVEVDLSEEIDMVKIPDKEEKFNKYIEKIIRSSFEYNRWIGILTNEMDLTQSKLIPAVDSKEKGLSIEMHHYPFSLYDIVSGYRLALQEAGEPYITYQPFEVAKRVMQLHYKGLVSVVPLDLTSHELYHSGQIFIPLTKDYVFGDWHKILDKGYISVSKDVSDNLKTLEDSTKKFIANGNKSDTNDLYLKQKQIKITDLSGVEAPKFIED